MGIVTGAINGPMDIANTAVNKTTAVVNNTVGTTLDTVNTTIDTVREVNESAQAVVQQTAQTGAKVSKEILKTTGNVATTALGVLDVNTANAASVANTASTQGTQVVNQTITQTGNVASTSIALAGNALYALIGTANNLAVSQSQHVKATAEMSNAMYDPTLMTKLHDQIRNMFNVRMSKLIGSLRDYSSTQKAFIRKSLGIYRAMNCGKGTLWGYTCLSNANTVVHEFEERLTRAMQQSDALILQLNALTHQIDASLMEVYGIATNLDQYKSLSFVKIQPFYKKSADIYVQIVGVFTKLTEDLNDKLNSGLQLGGRTKRRKLRKRTGKRRTKLR